MAEPVIAVLGASGLIGGAIASSLGHEGFGVLAVARRFTAAQANAFGDAATEAPVVDLDQGQLRDLLDRSHVDVVINCIGVLQDGPRGATGDVHRDFIERLTGAIGSLPRPALLMHVSIPGRDEDDRTPFSRTKREAERTIAESGVPHVILRPGFVIAETAFGASALLRGLAMLPVSLPRADLAHPFSAVGITDICETVSAVCRRWRGGETRWSQTWELLEETPSTVGDVVEAFRHRLGGPQPVAALPRFLLGAGAVAGDAAARLGWSPPIRSTSLAEMRRGVGGDPSAWMTATGIAPAPLAGMVRLVPSTVQERWFARLYLAKPLIIAILVVFWCLSGIIAMGLSFDAASDILIQSGFPVGLAHAVTVISSLTDIAIGIAIAFRRTCRAGLAAGIVVALGYMGGAGVLTPELWIEPLGALVKTFPAIVLMLVALAIFEER